MMMAEISGEGRRDVATIPPIECPIMIIVVFGGYNERIYLTALVVYAICDSRVGPWKAERSSLNSTKNCLNVEEFVKRQPHAYQQRNQAVSADAT